jgi:hypothetical protein
MTTGDARTPGGALCGSAFLSQDVDSASPSLSGCIRSIPACGALHHACGAPRACLLARRSKRRIGYIPRHGPSVRRRRPVTDFHGLAWAVGSALEQYGRHRGSLGYWLGRFGRPTNDYTGLRSTRGSRGLRTPRLGPTRVRVLASYIPSAGGSINPRIAEVSMRLARAAARRAPYRMPMPTPTANAASQLVDRTAVRMTKPYPTHTSRIRRRVRNVWPERNPALDRCVHEP